MSQTEHVIVTRYIRPPSPQHFDQQTQHSSSLHRSLVRQHLAESMPGSKKIDSYSADSAIDDSAEEDIAYAEHQRNVGFQRRRLSKESVIESQVQSRLPFHYCPMVRPLSISDIDSCIALEHAAFENEEHRASPEKLKYRLTACPELSLGIFCTFSPDKLEPGQKVELETLSAAKPVETNRPDHTVSVLLAHIVSTKSNSRVVTDNDMDFPRDYQNPSRKPSPLGHKEEGRTVALHSLAVSPKLQGCGLGKLIIKAYLQHIKQDNLADRVALIAQYHLISYYERFGFINLGQNKTTLGGGGWYDMVFEIGRPMGSSE